MPLPYFSDETSAPADDHAMTSDRHYEDQNNAKDVWYVMIGIETPPTEAYPEYQIPTFSRALDKAEVVDACLTEPKVDLAAPASQDAFFHPSRRAHLLARANDPLPVVSEASVKPRVITGANQEPLLTRKSRQGPLLGSAGNMGSTNKITYGQVGTHGIGGADYLLSVTSEQNTMPPTRLEYYEPFIPRESFAEHLSYHDGVTPACYIQRPDYQETDYEIDAMLIEEKSKHAACY